MSSTVSTKSGNRCNQTGLIFFRPSHRRLSRLYRNSNSDRVLLCAQVGAPQNLEGICGARGWYWRSVVARARSSDMRGRQGSRRRGIDVNPDARGPGQIEGLPVKSLDLKTVAREHTGRFEAVCSFQVLEHVAESRRVPEELSSPAEAGRDADRLGAQFRGIPQVLRRNTQSPAAPHDSVESGDIRGAAVAFRRPGWRPASPSLLRRPVEPCVALVR